MIEHHVGLPGYGKGDYLLELDSGPNIPTAGPFPPSLVDTYEGSGQ